MIAALVLAAAALASAQPDAHRELAFASNRHGNLDVYVIRADGHGLRRLTSSRGNDYGPVWSPDARRIAFRSDRDGNDEIYLMNADGSDQRNLTRSPDTTEYSPSWSPDGRMIAFASDRGREGETIDDIWTMDADGGNWRRLTFRVGIDEYPVWSPDGGTILFACTGGVILPQHVGDFEVCTMNADGSKQRRLTDAPGLSMAWSWAPDGSRIAFDSSRFDNPKGVREGGDLFTMDPNGSHVAQLTRGRPYDFEPVFSPSGGRIAFGSTRSGRSTDLYVMDADGTHIRRITRSSAEDGDPSWRP